MVEYPKAMCYKSFLRVLAHNQMSRKFGMPFGVQVLTKELKVGLHQAIGLSKSSKFKLDNDSLTCIAYRIKPYVKDWGVIPQAYIGEEEFLNTR